MIKNIIFDLGGVLFDIDYKKTFEDLSKLLGRKLESSSLPQPIEELFFQYEIGKLRTETFIWRLQQLSNNKIDKPHQLIKAWNAMLLGWKTSRLKWLLKVKMEYKTYLLSNTNAMHIDWLRRDLRLKYNIVEFETTYFHKVYYSHKIGFRKPNINAFQFVLEDQKIEKQETIFIDDTLENVESASKFGIYAFWHTQNQNIEDNLYQYIATTA